jgi:hypothetical protein
MQAYLGLRVIAYMTIYIGGACKLKKWKKPTEGKHQLPLKLPLGTKKRDIKVKPEMMRLAQTKLSHTTSKKLPSRNHTTI